MHSSSYTSSFLLGMINLEEQVKTSLQRCETLINGGNLCDGMVLLVRLVSNWLSGCNAEFMMMRQTSLANTCFLSEMSKLPESLQKQLWSADLYHRIDEWFTAICASGFILVDIIRFARHLCEFESLRSPLAGFFLFLFFFSCVLFLFTAITTNIDITILFESMCVDGHRDIPLTISWAINKAHSGVWEGADLEWFRMFVGRFTEEIGRASKKRLGNLRLLPTCNSLGLFFTVDSLFFTVDRLSFQFGCWDADGTH